MSVLKKFELENYKIFEEKISIDFSNIREYKFNEECIVNQIVSKAILYGKNAVGKTSLGYALMDIRGMVLPNELSNKNTLGFLNANALKNYASFHYVFQLGKDKISYHYEKYEPNHIKYEKLAINNELFYEFDYELKKGDFKKFQQYEEVKHLNFEEWDSETSVIRYILSNAKLKELLILKKLRDFVDGMAFLKPSEEIVKFKGPKILKDRIIPSIIEEDLIEDFMRFLKDAGLDLQLKADEKPDGEKALYFDYKKPLEFITFASSGTRALVSLYWVIHSLKQITFLFVDEFDANFHFELAEAMLNKFKSLEQCQILITTHNTDLMSNKHMRPDCYFLMLPNKITSIADASLRELRQGHNLEKLYQSGEFNEMVSD